MITLAIVKTMLGITTSDYNTQISAMIPIVESDVRRIMGHRFNEKVYCTITEGSDETTLAYLAYEPTYPITRPRLDHPVEPGRVIDSAAFPKGTYVLTSEEDGTIDVTFSEDATASSTYIRTSISISQWPTLAKMIWFKISKMNINKDWNGIQSKLMGPVSVTYATSIDVRWGYPTDLIKDLGTPYQRA